jgi:hypothetical protein
MLTILLLVTVIPSLGEGIESKKFKNMKEVRILVSSIPPDFRFTADDVAKHVYVKLKTKLPSLKIDTNPTSSIPYILYIPVTLYRTNGSARGHVNVEVRRKVFLPDKKTSLLAAVWSKGRLFGDSVNKIYPALKEQLDTLLDEFAFEYLQALEE